MFSVKIQLIQFRDAVHQMGHVLPELLTDLLVRHNGVFHHIVQKPRDNRLLIQLQICEDNGHIQRMDDIGLP